MTTGLAQDLSDHFNKSILEQIKAHCTYSAEMCKRYDTVTNKEEREKFERLADAINDVLAMQG